MEHKINILLDLLLLVSIIGASMIQIVAQTANKHSQHFDVAESTFHLTSLETIQNVNCLWQTLP